MPNVNEQTIYQAGSALAALAQQATARGALGVAMPGEFISAAATAIDFTEIFGPADLVKFAAAYSRPIRSLIIDMNPIQAGSGDPAPDNPREISGRTGANVYVSPTENVADATTYTVAFGDAGTVYGGTLDVVTGALTVTMAIVDLGALNWTLSAAGANIFTATLSGRKYSADIKAVCSIYPYKGTINQSSDAPRNGDKTCCFYYQPGQLYRNFYVYDTAYSDAASFKTAMNGVQLCYELATPLEYELTPQQIFTLLGSNNVWSNAGPVTVRL